MLLKSAVSRLPLVYSHLSCQAMLVYLTLRMYCFCYRIFIFIFICHFCTIQLLLFSTDIIKLSVKHTLQLSFSQSNSIYCYCHFIFLHIVNILTTHYYYCRLIIFHKYNLNNRSHLWIFHILTLLLDFLYKICINE